jgi:Ni,Fe-hydrogenase III large subunit
MLTEVCDRTDKVVKAMFAHATVLSRLENTGIVGKKRAKEIGLVGLAGRASGLETDSRIFDSLYSEFEHKIENLSSGDVYARAYLRYLEINSSSRLIEKMLMSLSGEISTKRHSLALAPNSFVFTIVEGWRGEIAHAVLTDSMSYIEHYKLKDPSVNNWFGLAIAVRNNQISDFPVCNKSFNLSYCGFDL